MKSEAPFLPMSFTLWRQVAVEKLKRVLAKKNINIVKEGLLRFCEEVDEKQLNDRFHD
jgi:hypothetical protein